ncbi:hypothetical protein PIB30_062837 [Stylosanthes scabra]|uniref:Uncharacterized protein n=1 Tax=Stylosanthes scabra TaxID=79078 RepID=A0ABU6UMX8_9FABA|nr:hypothetical protein [Stylosanthes scabra]
MDGETDQRFTKEQSDQLDVKDTYETGLYYGYGAICTERRTVVKPIWSIGHRIMSGYGTQMAANRRNARRVSVDSDPPADTATFMAAMNSMAIAMRDSTASIWELAVATNRAMEYMGRRNRKNGNGGDDE